MQNACVIKREEATKDGPKSAEKEMKRGFLLRLTPSLHSSPRFGGSSALRFARFAARSASGTLRRRRILGSSLGFAHIGGATSQAGIR